MAESTLKRESLADQAADAILQLVAERGLAAGDDLPSTAELSERFGVSRTVVREALAELAGRGVVTRSRGKESVITTPGSRQIQQVLASHLGRDGVGLASLLELRRGLEQEGVVLAAKRAGIDDIARIQQTIDAQASSATEAEYLDADRAFHREIAASTRNPLLTLVLDAINGLMNESRRSDRGRTRRRPIHRGIDDHRRILDAIQRRSPIDAAAAMNEHLDRTLDDLGTTRP